MGDYKTTRLLVCCVLDRIWYSTQRLEDLDLFRPNVPYVQYGGGVLALLLSSPGAQSSEGSLQTVSSSVEPLGVQSFATWGAFPFIVQGGDPIYIYLALCVGSVWESFVLVSRRGPLGQSGVGRLEPGWFYWPTGCPSVVPSWASRDSLVTRMVAQGSSPVLSACAYATYPQGYLTSSSHSPWL